MLQAEAYFRLRGVDFFSIFFLFLFLFLSIPGPI